MEDDASAFDVSMMTYSTLFRNFNNLTMCPIYFFFTSLGSSRNNVQRSQFCEPMSLMISRTLRLCLVLEKFEGKKQGRKGEKWKE